MNAGPGNEPAARSDPPRTAVGEPDRRTCGPTGAATGALLCRGAVRHARLGPRRHAFRYPAWMLLVDLESPPELPWWLRPLVRLGGGHLMTARSVRARLAEAGAGSGDVRILALTQPGFLGHSFNPVNIYLCERGGMLASVLLQVTSTPWGEEHCYVLDAPGRPLAGSHRFDFPKAFHVSPFLSMEGSYRLRLDLRGGRLRVALRLEGGSAPFAAGLSLRTQPFTAGAALAASLRAPAQNALTLARIYWQAGRLFAKRAPFFPHPGRIR